jgi:hypothetical protein
LAEGIAAILLVRDAALVAVGTPAVLRPAHARLLYLELAAAIAATLTGLRPVVGRGTASSVGPPGDALELVRRTSMVVLFAIHTVRFWVYLQPDHGLKEDRADHGQSINWRAHTMRPSWRVGDSRYRTKRATERRNRVPADPALP